MLKIKIEMENSNEIELAVDMDKGWSLGDVTTATTSLVNYIVEKVCENQLAKISGLPREFAIDFVLSDIKDKLKGLEKGEATNA